MKPGLLTSLLLAAVAAALPARAGAQVIITLNTVIGVSGTNAATVAGAGNVVNATGFALNSGPTILTSVGSAGSSSFDFNTGFLDRLDRAVGSNAGIGTANVYADRKFDSGTTAPLVLDTNGDGLFTDENPAGLSGFGMHGDGFITFDLDELRTAKGLASGTPFTLTGIAGIANTSLAPTSGAIITDGVQRAVFDWDVGAGKTLSTFTITLGGSERYLTFAGLSGLDGDNFFAHVGFANVQLTAVPEPSTVALLGLGLAVLALRTRRRR